MPHQLLYIQTSTLLSIPPRPARFIVSAGVLLHWLIKERQILRRKGGAKLFRREESFVFALQHKAGQAARRKCARIYVNPVGEDFWLVDRRMAVNNDFSKICPAVKKVVSDP